MQIAVLISALACLRVSQALPTKKKLLICSRSQLNPVSLAACRQEDSILERRSTHKLLLISPINSTFMMAGGLTQPFLGSHRRTSEGNWELAQLDPASRGSWALSISVRMTKRMRASVA